MAIRRLLAPLQAAALLSAAWPAPAWARVRAVEPVPPQVGRQPAAPPAEFGGLLGRQDLAAPSAAVLPGTLGAGLPEAVPALGLPAPLVHAAQPAHGAVPASAGLPAAGVESVETQPSREAWPPAEGARAPAARDSFE